MTAKADRAAGWVRMLIGVLAVLLFAYVAIRAFTVSITYDESFSYVNHVRHDKLYQDTYDQMGANHHLLNVWMMWLSSNLFGDSELALRLPSVMAFGIYLFSCARIALMTKHGALAIGGFLLLVVHPYLLDFFLLARGYAFANAFLMLASWQSLEYLNEGRDRTFAMPCAAAGLAALSHIIMLNFLIAFSAFWAIWFWLRHRKDGTSGRTWMILAASFCVPVLILLPYMIGLLGGGSINYGCDTFWTCSMRTLAEMLTYQLPLSIAPLDWLGAFLMAIAGVVLVALFRRRLSFERKITGLHFALFLPAFVVLSLLMQNILLDVPLPRTRTGLFLLPMLALVLVLGLRSWADEGRYSGASSLLMCSPLILLFARTINFDHVIEWRSTGTLRDALTTIRQDRTHSNWGRSWMNIRCCFETTGCMPYYIHSRQWYDMNYQTRSDTAFQPADYYIVETGSHHLVDRENWTELYRSNSIDMTVYRDERFRRNFDLEIYQAAFTDASHEEHRHPTLSWIVPEDIPQGPFIVKGWIDAVEQGPTNWIGHIMELWRNGRIIGLESSATHLQLGRYGEHARTGVVLLYPGPILRGDSIRYRAWPYIPQPVISLGTAELRIMQ